ncbi:hypothetical protein NG796_25340 [Laspinema sp. A4]|uniref:hypothetical protein n=1 Tax=Laspinema sp. D2d TaxID=2953686 RepID=UPI0021BAFC99|nr:hypothetical protein [Laspinema sp. D2d]MCT7986600.1 hypothetical protein [Laspinema sp. D2d]
MLVGPTEVVSPLLGVCQVTHPQQETPVPSEALKQLIQRVMESAVTQEQRRQSFPPHLPHPPHLPNPPHLPHPPHPPHLPETPFLAC